MALVAVVAEMILVDLVAELALVAVSTGCCYG